MAGAAATSGGGPVDEHQWSERCTWYSGSWPPPPPTDDPPAAGRTGADDPPPGATASAAAAPPTSTAVRFCSRCGGPARGLSPWRGAEGAPPRADAAPAA
eukprot:gene19970-11209_t